MCRETHALLACRYLCCLVAIDICRLCACGIMVLVLPTTWNGLENAIGPISNDGRSSDVETHAKSCSSMDEGESMLGQQLC